MITKYNDYIKESKAKESKSVDSYFLQTYEETKAWLDSMKIKNYTINDDLTVDVDDDVNLYNKNLTKIPVKFNKVNNFYCSYNQLTSLAGAPTKVNIFDCSYNQLTSLTGAPTKVNNFYCYNNQLTSLTGAPTTVNNFYCQYNQLTSLAGAPTTVNIFDCSSNKLTSLAGSPTKVNNFYCDNNKLEDITDLNSKILIKSIKDNRDWTNKISTDLYDNYFEHWITKDINIVSALKDKVSDNIKNKYKHLFNANNFDLL